MSEEREREGENARVSAESRLIEEKKEKKWKRSGQGKGNRWLMLRDLLAIISLRPMNNMLVQDTMFLHRGLKRETVRNMLDQLDRTKSIEQVPDASGVIKTYVWIATEGGVQFWIGSRKDIPASIARVAWTMKSANSFGEVSE